MQAIKIKLHQESANYRLPQSFQYRDSYPLPPYSTVIGMIHNLTQFTKYHPMKVSIQGTSGHKTSDLYTRYEGPGTAGNDADFFKLDKKTGEMIEIDRKRWNIVFNNKDGSRQHALSRGTGRNELLSNINLVLHIIPDNPDDLNAIYNAFKYPFEYPSLGRREDLVEIKEVKLVDITSTTPDGDYYSNIGGYIPQSFIRTLDLSDNPDFANGTYFNLNHDFKIATISKNKTYRKWHQVHAMYKDQFTIDEDATLDLDSDGQAVFAI